MLDHLDDLDADFRVHYGIAGVGDEEFGALSAERFFALADRVAFYQGVLHAIITAQHAGHAGTGAELEQGDVDDMSGAEAELMKSLPMEVFDG